MISNHLPRNLSSLLQPLQDLSPRRELLALLLIVAETMILYIVAGTFLAEREAPYTPLPILLIFAILTFARLVPHLLSTIRVWTPEYEIVMGISIALSMLVIIKLGAFPNTSIMSLDWLLGTRDSLIMQENDAARHVWMLVVFVCYAWWRGRWRAEPNLETAYNMLRFGLLWLAGALVFTALTAPPDALIHGQINAVLVGFLVVTLLSIAIARQPEGEDSAAWNASWVWLLILSIPILAIAATSISTTGVLTRDTLNLFISVLSPVFWLLQITLQALVLTIAIIAFVLVSPLIWFLERQGFAPLSNFPSIDLSPGSVSDAEELARSTLHIENPVRYLIAGSILLGMTWLLIRFSYRRRRHWQENSRQQRESLIEWGQSDGTVFQRMKRWVENRIRPSRAYALQEGAEWEYTRRIRQTYQRFLRFSKDHGAPREPGETPAHLAHRIRDDHPNLAAEVQALTERYNYARYSGKPATLDDAEVTEQAWKSLRERNKSWS
jgi:hypothetical protein